MRNLMLFSVIFLFALSACKKNDAGVAQTPQQNQNNKTEALILNFKDKIENHLKDGGTYAGDSAVWYVEALLNYSYCNASVACRDYKTDTTEITVNPTSINSYSIEQLALVFDYLEAEVLANQPQNTNIIAIDVFTYPAGNLTIFASRTTYATPRTPACKSLADTSGYWFWGAEKGMCGSDSGLYVGVDATHIIENIINGTVGYNDYYTDLEYNGASYWSNYVDPYFPYDLPYLMDRRLFAAYGPWLSVLNYCMSPELISYYCSEDGIPFIIDDLCPPRKQFVCCNVEGGAADYDNDQLVFHSVYITYGVPHN